MLEAAQISAPGRCYLPGGGVTHYHPAGHEPSPESLWWGTRQRQSRYEVGRLQQHSQTPLCDISQTGYIVQVTDLAW